MPRKPANRVGNSDAEDPVLLAKRRLIADQDKILRQQRELEQVIKDAPGRIERQRRRDRDFVRINVSTPASTALTAGGLRDKFSSDSDTTGRRRRPRKSERTMARVQFVILCLILMTILVVIWRSIG